MKRELNKYLNSLSEKELIREVKKLFDRFPAVQDFYAMELAADTSKILDEYKKKIQKEYMPVRGYGRASSSASLKIIRDFKKISIHAKDVVELLLYRTEMMIEFSKAYGDINEAFYNSLASSFAQACKLISKEKLEKEFRTHCQTLVGDTYDFGWGVYDELNYIYSDHF